MSAGDARRGRRDNGLIAAEYAAAGDVDPRVGEHLLDVLARDGIAAYLRPSTDLHPVTRSSSLPNRPTDRLYVDRVHLATARDLLSQFAADDADAERTNPAGAAATGLAPGQSTGLAGESIDGDTGDVDDVWAQIVAGYNVDAPGRSWPDAEDLPERGGEPSDPTLTVSESAPRRIVSPPAASTDEPSLLDGLDTFGADLPDEDEEGYTPPVAPPLPRPSLSTALAIAGIIGGLILFLQPTMLPVSENVAMLTGFTAVMGGFATLVWRLRPGDDDDDTDPDDGARV